MDNNKPYSNLDALQELDAYDAAIEKACKYLKGDLEEDLEESYSDDFEVEDDWGPKATIDEEGNITFHHKSWSRMSESAQSPEPGDCVVALIKLTYYKPEKHVYNGCERRPVLVSEIVGDKFNALEITHSPTFENLDLVRTPSLDIKGRPSYVNVYTYYKDCYHNLDTSYDFPIAFNEDGTPQTKSQYFSSATISGDSEEPFIFPYTYVDNYKSHISEEDWKKVKAEYEAFKADLEKAIKKSEDNKESE